MNQMELGAEIEALLNRSKTRHIQSSEKGSFQRKVETFTFVTFAVFIIALIGFAAGNQGRYPDGTKDAAIEPVSAAEVVQSLPNNPAISDSSAELPPQTVSEQETVDPNSYQNFDTAKRVVGMCQGNENCLDQVRRWETAGYDATTVIRMILIFNKESGWQYDQVSTNTNGSRRSILVITVERWESPVIHKPVSTRYWTRTPIPVWPWSYLTRRAGHRG
jgi:hypothetical protein